MDKFTLYLCLSIMKRKHYLTIFPLMLNVALAQGPAWPTDASRMLSSNFGEFRDTHFHMGLDIKTKETEGHPVFAVSDGFISRMVTNYAGYGKALYLTTETNHIAVYGHLSRFSSILEKVLRNNQIINQSYFVNEYFSDFEFPVKQGDIIGYTGNTGGSFGPHLHFEYRDGKDQPLNPLLYGFELPDRFSPMLKQLAVIPLKKGTMINGSSLPQVFPLYRDEEGFFHFPDTINCQGTVGIAIQMDDQIQGSPYKYQIHRAELWVDEILHYILQYDSLNYSQSFINEARQFGLSRLNLGEFHQFYHLDSHPYFSAKNKKMSGIITLESGYHTVEIKAWDCAENLSSAKGVIFAHPPITMNILEANRTNQEITFDIQPGFNSVPLKSIACYSFTPFGFQNGKIDLIKEISTGEDLRFRLPLKQIKNRILQFIGVNNQGAFSYPVHWAEGVKSHDILSIDVDLKLSHLNEGIILQVETNAYTDASISVFLKGEGLFTPIWVNQVRPTVYLSEVLSPALFNGVQTIEVLLKDQIERKIQFNIAPKLATPENSVYVFSRDQMCSIGTTKNSVYDSTILWIDTVEKSAPIKSGVHLSKVYQLQPFEILLKDSIKIGVRFSNQYNHEDGLGLYYYNQKEEEWTFLPTRVHWKQSSLTSTISSLDAITIIQDTIPPSVTSTFPAHGGHYDKRDVMNFNAFIKDDLSGIEPAEKYIAMYLDGERLYASYQPVEQELSARLDSPLRTGGHELLIYVEDRAGHHTKKPINFSVY